MSDGEVAGDTKWVALRAANQNKRLPVAIAPLLVGGTAKAVTDEVQSLLLMGKTTGDY